MAKKRCFVIMPFAGTKCVKTEEGWTKIYEDLFKPIWKKAGYECERINIKRGSITKNIIKKLFSADLVFADLTDSKPNVMYELGVRHTFNKPSLMVKQKRCTIPFDVSGYVVNEYVNDATGIIKLSKLVKETVKDYEENPSNPDNPVWDFLDYGGFMIDYYKNKENIKRLESLIDELEHNKATITLLRQKTHYNNKGSFTETQAGLLLSGLQEICYNYLKSTMYVNFEPENWETINEYYKTLQMLKTTSSHLISLHSEIEKKGDDSMGCVDRMLESISKSIKIIDEKINQLSY